MPEGKSDYQKYLDEKFKSLQKTIEQHQAYNKLELKQIKDNTERTNSRVSSQEDRIRQLENKQISCPINSVVERQEQLARETRPVRASSKLVVSGFFMALLTAIGLLMRIFEVI